MTATKSPATALPRSGGRRVGKPGRGEVASLHKPLLNLTLNLFLNPRPLPQQIKITIKSKIKNRVALLFACLAYFAVQSHAAEAFTVLKSAAFAHHLEHFNTMEPETVVNHIPNSNSWAWLQKNIPLFECPDPDVEEIYYFRWWSFRKHIKQTPQRFVITEFLPPVNHAGEFNTISCAAGFHLAEGRWLRDDRYLNDYIQFWLRGDNGKPAKKFHNFSSWFAAATWDRYLVNADKKFLVKFLPDLTADYRVWETERQLPSGLFWQFDVRDGMEESISGSRTAKNIRPTINSYMFANASAIANMARLANRPRLADEFTAKAADLKRLTQEALWDANANSFKVLIATTNPSVTTVALSSAREAIGFVPWMFNLPDSGPSQAAAFAQLSDPRGFSAPFGLTTAERRHPQFRNRGVGTCEWDGAIWPFATSQTLYALANHLRSDSLSPSDGERAGVRGNPALNPQPSTPNSFFDAFLTYTRSQHANGKPYIGEYLDEVTGDWINRNDRSRYYNHSTYADLLITGVIGLIPRADDTLEISPLVPPHTWDWFCLDGVKYHGHMLTVIWDKDGSRYGRGAGLRVLANGKPIATSEKLTRITGKLP
jgi:hypothetical protein